MKNINVTFEDEEIDFLEQLKGSTSWRAFILGIAKYKTKEGK